MIDNKTLLPDLNFNRTINLSFDMKVEKVNKLFKVGVLCNSYNNLLEFEFEHNDEVNYRIIRNLGNSKFLDKFCKLATISNATNVKVGKQKSTTITIDAKNYISWETKDKSHYSFLNETYMFSKVSPVEEYDTNMLNLKAFAIKEIKNQYVFLYVTRTKYYPNNKKKIIRTAGIELSVKDLNIDEYIDNFTFSSDDSITN